jgi:hypothetical protein
MIYRSKFLATLRGWYPDLIKAYNSAMLRKTFVDIRKRYGTDGSPCEYDYVYEVGGQEVLVEVHATVTHIWNVGVLEIRQAAEDLIDAKVQKGWSSRQTNRLLLDEFSVRPIAEKLGWTPLLI